MKNSLERSIISTFHASMIQLAGHCRRLELAINDRDADVVTHAAQNAASAWHAGWRDCRRLAASHPESQNVDGARDHLWQRYMTLFGLLAQALCVVPHARCRELQRLRHNLTKEMSRPLVDRDATRRERVKAAMLPTP